MWGFPKIRDTIFRAPILRAILGAPYLGKLPYGTDVKNPAWPLLFCNTIIPKAQRAYARAGFFVSSVVSRG